VDGGSLVANGDESHSVLLQLGEQRIDLRTRESEHELDTLADQASQKQLCSSNFAHKILPWGRRLVGIEAMKQSKQENAWGGGNPYPHQ
jgi:hypothetical protein